MSTIKPWMEVVTLLLSVQLSTFSVQLSANSVDSVAPWLTHSALSFLSPREGIWVRSAEKQERPLSPRARARARW